MILRGYAQPQSDRHAMALSLDPVHNSQDGLAQILSAPESCPAGNLRWDLTRTAELGSALEVVRDHPIAVLICAADDRPLLWKEMLEGLRSVSHPPALIVASRMADERLWAEALNLGAYDVLSKPFHRAEVVRSLCSAWLHWKNRAAAEPVRMKAAS